ncbi:Uncharacterised protein [Klebsiella pneumoniae]|nr:Uncharacterised protein [Klebsiella pneumoniae]
MGLGGSEARKRAFAEDKLTAVGRFHAGDNLHQRRFPGAVAAHQRVYLAGKQREINLLQHGDAGELFADLASFKQWLHHRASF